MRAAREGLCALVLLAACAGETRDYGDPTAGSELPFACAAIEPADYQTLDEAHATLAVTLRAGEGAKVLLATPGGEPVALDEQGGRWQVEVSLLHGLNTFELTAVDRAGGGEVLRRAHHLSHEGREPALIIDEPPAGARLAGSDWLLSGRVSAGEDRIVDAVEVDARAGASGPGEVASVSSIGWEPLGMFDLGDREWLQIEGLNPAGPQVEQLGFGIVESPESFSPGALGESDAPVASVSISEGWFEAATKADLGDPPPPMYVWDLLLDVAQRRLHDPAPGSDTPPGEGEASVRFDLESLVIGMDNDDIVATIEANMAADPAALVQAARFLFGNGDGAADLFYARVPDDGRVAPGLEGDWLL